MAVRIRADGRIFCAAMNPPAAGDTYLDDALHYKLSAVLKVLVTTPMDIHAVTNGEWYWRNEVPPGVTIDPYYCK